MANSHLANIASNKGYPRHENLALHAPDMNMCKMSLQTMGIFISKIGSKKTTQILAIKILSSQTGLFTKSTSSSFNNQRSPGSFPNYNDIAPRYVQVQPNDKHKTDEPTD